MRTPPPKQFLMKKKTMISLHKKQWNIVWFLSLFFFTLFLASRIISDALQTIVFIFFDSMYLLSNISPYHHHGRPLHLMPRLLSSFRDFACWRLKTCHYCAANTRMDLNCLPGEQPELTVMLYILFFFFSFFFLCCKIQSKVEWITKRVSIAMLQ